MYQLLVWATDLNEIRVRISCEGFSDQEVGDVNGSELHAQASIWDNHGHRDPVLVMEGEAKDRTNGGGVMPDALYRAVLNRGLRLTTDLEHLDPRPVPGWRMRIGDDHAVTLEWPHFWPLLQHAPLDLPEEWMRVVKGRGSITVFVGYGLGMCEHCNDGAAHPLEHLEHVAETGALAAGMVPVLV